MFQDLKTRVFSCPDGNQALSLQWESSPCTAVWDLGLYAANSWINQIYPGSSVPIALRLLGWANGHCCSKGLRKWALMERGKGWWGVNFHSEVRRTAHPYMMIIPVLRSEQHLRVSAYGTNSMWVPPWSFICSSRRWDWKGYERSLHTALNLGWGEDTSAYQGQPMTALFRVESLNQIHFSAKCWLFGHSKLENSCCKGKRDKTSLCLKTSAHTSLMWSCIWKHCAHSASTNTVLHTPCPDCGLIVSARNPHLFPWLQIFSYHISRCDCKWAKYCMCLHPCTESDTSMEQPVSILCSQCKQVQGHPFVSNASST